MHTASYYTSLDKNKVRCHLCPHSCLLEEGSFGKCKVRQNLDGALYAMTYGQISGMAIDPMEKKPLYHFLPGTGVLSIGSLGCNLSCSFCQNAHISQADPSMITALSTYECSDIIRQARSNDQGSIAYTYNEPSVFFEFMIDTARHARSEGIRNVMVSNGFLNAEPLSELLELVDGFNIDLKAYSDEFYHDIAHASLKPVLNTISKIAKSDKHLEITYLVIPGLNDDEDNFSEMIQWIYEHCGADQVLHLSRYFPNHHMHRENTPVETISRLLDIARRKLRFVYPGNTSMALDSNTYCPNCRELLIERKNYSTRLLGISAGSCLSCNSVIPGVFNN